MGLNRWVIVLASGVLETRFKISVVIDLGVKKHFVRESEKEKEKGGFTEIGNCMEKPNTSLIIEKCDVLYSYKFINDQELTIIKFKSTYPLVNLFMYLLKVNTFL